YCLPLEEMAPLLVRLTTAAAAEEGAFQVPKEVEIEVNIAKEQKALDAGVLQLGEPSNYACPECHGVLLQVKDGGSLFRFRCHTGHAYSIVSLLTDITEKMDDALWNSIRAFEEGELFMRHYGRAFGPRGEQPIRGIDSQTCRRYETTSPSNAAGAINVAPIAPKVR